MTNVIKTLEVSEKQAILVSWLVQEKTSKNPTASFLIDFGNYYFRNGFKATADTYEKLLEKSIIRKDGQLLILKKENYGLAIQTKRDKEKQEFQKMLNDVAKSKSYSEYTTTLHGKDLSQMNMITMSQLDEFIDILDLKPGSRILDMGCGVGKISEYISNRTNTDLCGIDYIQDIIDLANVRAADNDNLEFLTADLDDLDFPANSFDVVISLDSLYFAENLERTVKRMLKITKPNGKVAVFYGQILKDDEPKDKLLHANTELGIILQNEGVNYTAYDKSSDEEVFWQRSLEVAGQLETKFKDEGNIDIFDNLVFEAKNCLSLIEQDRLSRYLFVINT